MKLIAKNGKHELWEVPTNQGVDYYVYGYFASGDPKVCLSLGMAWEYYQG